MLLLPSLLAIVSAHEIRHSKQRRAAAASPSGVSPCSVPALESEAFVRECTGYYQKGWACIRSPTALVSKSTVGRIEEEMKGQMGFCHYDLIRRRVEVRPIGDEILIAAERRRQAKAEEEERRRKAQHIQGHPPGTKDRPPKLEDLLRPMHRRFRFSLTVMDRYLGAASYRGWDAHWLQSQATELGRLCATQDTSGLLRSANATHYARLVRDIFAGESRALWSFGDCETDIAVLVLGTPEGDENRRRPTLSVALSALADRVLGPELREIEARVNADQALVTAGAQLRAFAAALMPIYMKAWPPFPERKQHRIPAWAVWVFAVSGILSIAAVVVGNLVTENSKRSNASAAGAAKKSGGKRNWGAGFSGGMWKG